MHGMLVNHSDKDKMCCYSSQKVDMNSVEALDFILDPSTMARTCDGLAMASNCVHVILYLIG